MQDIIVCMANHDMQKAALRGEPSYVWRAGQQRRLEMIVRAAGGANQRQHPRKRMRRRNVR